MPIYHQDSSSIVVEVGGGLVFIMVIDRLLLGCIVFPTWPGHVVQKNPGQSNRSNILYFRRKGSLKGRKWKSIFNLGGRLHDPRRRNKNSAKGE